MGCCGGNKSTIVYRLQNSDGTLSTESYRTRAVATMEKDSEQRIKAVRATDPAPSG